MAYACGSIAERVGASFPKRTVFKNLSPFFLREVPLLKVVNNGDVVDTSLIDEAVLEGHELANVRHLGIFAIFIFVH